LRKFVKIDNENALEEIIASKFDIMIFLEIIGGNKLYTSIGQNANKIAKII
jgi:hypothetical protein